MNIRHAVACRHCRRHYLRSTPDLRRALEEMDRAERAQGYAPDALLRSRRTRSADTA